MSADDVITGRVFVHHIEKHLFDARALFVDGIVERIHQTVDARLAQELGNLRISGNSGNYWKRKIRNPFVYWDFGSLICWGTRTRTRKGRTRICSVTITPYPNHIHFCNSLPNCGCKGTTISEITKTFCNFFLKKLIFFHFLHHNRIKSRTFVAS